MADIQTFDFDLMGTDAMAWKITRHEDHTDVLTQNYKDRQSGANGWKPGRGARQIARIPIAAMEIAENLGYDMDSMEGVYKFLSDYPKYKTVQYIKSPGNGRIIIN